MPDTAPRVRAVLVRGAARLRAAGIDTPELDSSILLAHALGVTRAALYAHALEPVTPESHTAYAAMLDQRVAHVPVAYLTGTKEFMGLPFAVSSAVLVPRPETELLVEWAVAWLASQQGSCTVVDVGTGSGAVAVSVAKLVPASFVIASDISRSAIQVAQVNARTHEGDNHVHFLCGNLLTWLGGHVDLVLANLPYLTENQADAPELVAEPRNALVGGEGDGFALYRQLLAQAETRLNAGGAFAFEIDPSQADIAASYCNDTFRDAHITVHHDLANFARFLTVETAFASGPGHMMVALAH